MRALPRHVLTRTPVPVSGGRRRSLKQMQWVAAGLLAAAAVLYTVSMMLAGSHPAWRYVAAFSEAAMVGAIADWFAVVALFRHPLGLPIPHTAIIPSNKDRIGRELADFICGNFLATQQVLEKLRAFDPAGALARWLATPANAEQVSQHALAAARYGLAAFDDARVQRFVAELLTTQLRQVDVTRVAGQVLDVLTAQGRHQALLDEVLQQLGELLRDEEIQARLAEVVAGEVKYLRYIGLDVVAGHLAAKKIVAGVGRLVTEMGEDPDHDLRLRFDRFMAEYVERLKTDPAMQARGEQLKLDILAHPAIGEYLQGVWRQLLSWLEADLASDDSSIGQRLRDAALGLGTRLQRDAAMRQWINDQVFAAAPAMIDRYREDIRRYIASRVDAWDTAEMTRELERSIGRDLQFVRINGTLVGGLVGLAIFSLSQWLQP